MRYVAKDWRKQFRFTPETTVPDAVATCVQAFTPGDRDSAFAPHQQYGLYLFRKVPACCTHGEAMRPPLLTHPVLPTTGPASTSHRAPRERAGWTMAAAWGSTTSRRRYAPRRAPSARRIAALSIVPPPPPSVAAVAHGHGPDRNRSSCTTAPTLSSFRCGPRWLGPSLRPTARCGGLALTASRDGRAMAPAAHRCR